MSNQERASNHLADQSSPYLLQHADNPVDWYPWGDKAFEKARAEDRPIFLSIGYSTCHWCHVMKRESFEDQQVAKLMNEAFVNIKVDREERPDIDAVYMKVCQMVTGSGGWPLTIIMTPEKKPFFAATYIPKEGRFGRRGLLQLIPEIHQAWENRRQELLDNADDVTVAVRDASSQAPGAGLGDEALTEAFDQLVHRFDSEHGGFSQAPKFPSPHTLLFLLRHHFRTRSARAGEMVEKTLDEMRMGGMYDQVGYGFHRYSTDREWLVPHFEKMLYDQALLAMAYTEGWQVFDKPEYRRTACETLEYVLRDMTDDSGGFYSAEDAESEGVEGKFYVWSEDEIREALDPEDADLAIELYGVKSGGNYEDEVSGARTGANILHLDAPVPREHRADFDRIRSELYAYRQQRVAPGLDDKILTDWNGLMIAALARVGQAMQKHEYINAAANAADFILDEMQDENGRLLHRYRDGKAGIIATLDDYAFFIFGLLDLYEATFETGYLQEAARLAGLMIEHFEDEANGGFYVTADDAEELLARQKEIYDGAIPSGNSVAMFDLVRLAHMTGDYGLEDRADALVRAFSEQVLPAPSGHTFLMCALDFAIGPTYQVVIAGEENSPETQAIVGAIRKEYVPNTVLVMRPADDTAPITQLAEYTQPLEPGDGGPTIFVCRHDQCQQPTDDIAEVLQMLQER